MRILMATTAQLSHPGAVNPHLELLIESLRRQGHEVDLIHPLQDRVLWELVRKEMQAVGLPSGPLNEIEAAQAALELRFLRLGAAYDVVHCHDTWAWNALADVVPEGTPVLLSMYTDLYVGPQIQEIDSALREYFQLCQSNALGSADHLICHGEEAAGPLVEAARRRPDVLKSPGDPESIVEQFIALYRSAASRPRRRVREHSGRMHLAARRVAEAAGIPAERFPKPFRLLLGSLDYPRMGGVTSHIRKLVRALRKRGFVIDLVHPGNPLLNDSAYMRVRRLAEATRPPFRYDMLDLYWDLQAAELQIQVVALRQMGVEWDAVHCHDIVSTVRLMAVVAGIPFFCTTHGPAVEEELAKGHVQPASFEEQYLRELEAAAMENCQQVFVVGAQLLERIRKRYPDAPLVQVPNWVDTDQFRPQGGKQGLRRRLGLPENEFLVFSPSRMDYNKGLEYLMQAAADIEGTVVLVRSRPDMETVLKSQYRGGRVELIDPVDPDHMPDLYAAMDICVLPSIRVAGTQESFPISALEAVACEVPLVATDVGGLGEILAQVGLAPVAEKSAQAIAHRVACLRSNPEEAQRMAREAREKLCRLYAETVVTSDIISAYRLRDRRMLGTTVLPFRNLLSHLEQVLWLLEQERVAEALAVHLRRGFRDDERDFAAHYLALWLDELSRDEHLTWRARLCAWLHENGWDPQALVSVVEPALPSLSQQIDHWRAAEYTQRTARLQGRRQQLAGRPGPGDTLHVVYVMTHVAVTGGAKVIFDHANHLHDLGVKVTIVSHYPRPTWYPARCEYRQVPFQIDLADAIPPCDVIVATYWDHIQACVDTGLAPVVYFEQGDFHLFEQVQPDLLRVVRAAIQSAAEVITCSDSIVDVVRQRYGREIAHVFPNAVDPEIFHPGSGDGAACRAQPYMMMMGSDRVAFKGTEDVLQAWEQVKAHGVDLDLVWVSPVPLARPAGRVYVKPDQRLLAQLYRGATVFVSGSRYETFPLPPLEAMASGCPVVTTANQGVLTYAEDGVNCLLAEIGNPHSLAAQIMRVVKDEGLRHRLQEGGLQTAARYSWAATAAHLRTFYEAMGRFRPEPRNRIQEWEVTPRAFLGAEGWEQLSRLMEWTDADVISAPAVVPAFEGHLIARWIPVARRRQASGREARLWCPVAGEVADLPYLKAWTLFTRGAYDAALALFREHFRSARSPEEQAVYVRWIVLCLLEMNRDGEAMAILRHALQLHGSNTDLMYLRGVALSLQGRWRDALEYRDRVVTLGESAAYPEFFWGLPILAVQRLRPHEEAE